jgi:hypothetical protein
MCNAGSTDCNPIGEIEDIVRSKLGQIIGSVPEVGGFMGLGDKYVVIAVDDVNLIAVDNKSYAVVTYMNEKQLDPMEEADDLQRETRVAASADTESGPGKRDAGIISPRPYKCAKLIRSP